MANIGTAFSGLLSGLGRFGSSALDRLGSFVGTVAPFAEIGLSTAAGVQALRQSQQASPALRPIMPAQIPNVSVRPQGALAFPGGAPMAYVSTTGFGAAAQTAGIGGAVQSLQGLGQALVPGGSPGPVGCIAPVATRGGMRLPRLVNVPNPTDPSKIETYVRAPRPRYRVTISGPRRRCRGGR